MVWSKPDIDDTVYNVHYFPEEFSIFLKIPIRQECYFLQQNRFLFEILTS